MLAHQMAFANPLIQAEMVEATDFPELSEEFMVSSVPHTVINHGQHDFVGAMPESEALAQIQQALK